MKWFLNEKYMDLFNCISQCIIAVAAVVAIIITIRQISSKTKINLKMHMNFVLNEKIGEKAFVELKIQMVNLSMAPLFVSSCGIQLWDNRKVKLTIPISEKPFVLRPGQSETVADEYLNELINDIALLHDRVRIYAESQMDKVYYEKKYIFYDEFKHEFEKCNKRANKINKDMAM